MISEKTTKKTAKTKEKQNLHKLKLKARAMPATVQIGKNGLTEASIEELKKQLKKRKLVKIKLVKGFVEQLKESSNKTKKEIAIELAEKTNSELIDAVGFVVVLWKR